MMSQKQLRLGEIHQQMMIAQMFPKFEPESGASGRESRLAQLKLDKRKLRARSLEKMRRNIRNFNSDPAVIEAAEVA